MECRQVLKYDITWKDGVTVIYNDSLDENVIDCPFADDSGLNSLGMAVASFGIVS